jgi:hypothetical protein
MVERHDLFFLKPNAVWEVDGNSGEAVGGLHELVQQQVAPGQNAQANALLKDLWLPLLREAGARILGVFDMAAGTGMPTIVLLYAWPDAATWHAGHKLIDAHGPLREALAAQRKALGTAAVMRAEVNLLEPAPGATVYAGLGRTAT